MQWTKQWTWAGRVGAALLLAASVSPAGAELTREDFLVKNAGDLVTLCTAPDDDPLRLAAIGFCHGYVVGAWQYHEAMAAGKKGKGRAIVCPPDPRPKRTEAIDGFIAWMKANPQYNGEPAVEAMFKYLVETWPCPAAGGKGK